MWKTGHYIERNRLDEYPHTGVFFIREEYEDPEGDVFKDGTAVETLVLETPCDIIQVDKSFSSGTIKGDYDVYFPTEHLQKVPVRIGQHFRCDDYPIPMSGLVIGVAPGQLGCEVQIKKSDV